MCALVISYYPFKMHMSEMQKVYEKLGFPKYRITIYFSQSVVKIKLWFRGIDFDHAKKRPSYNPFTG